jgi:hypothetical protein
MQICKAPNGNYVVVGYMNSAYTSPDLVTWTQRAFSSTLPNSGTWYPNGLISNGTILFSWSYFGNYTYYYTSSDSGVTWSMRTYPSLVQNTGPFAAVWTGSYYLAPMLSDSSIYKSADAINWTKVSLSQSYWDIAYGNGIVIAVNTAGKYAKSTDSGATWTESTISSLSSASTMAISYANGVFVAFDANNGIGAYSTNGTTWTATALPSTGRFYNTLNYNTGTELGLPHIGVGYAGMVATSTNGADWATMHLPTAYISGKLSYSNGVFIGTGALVGSTNSTIYLSEDGVDWTAQATGITAEYTLGAYDPGNDAYVVLAKSSVTYPNGPVLVSTQSSATSGWQMKQITSTATTFTGITYSEDLDRFIVWNNSSTTAAYASDVNTSLWTSVTLPAIPTTTNGIKVTRDGIYWLLLENSTGYYTNDLAGSWTSFTLETGAWLPIVGAYNNPKTKYVTIRNGTTRVAYVNNGDTATTWNYVNPSGLNSITNPTWTSGIYSGSGYIFVGTGTVSGKVENLVIYSDNGIDWTYRLLTPTGGGRSSGAPALVGESDSVTAVITTQQPQTTMKLSTVSSVTI